MHLDPKLHCTNYLALARSALVTFTNLILLISSEEVLVGFKSNCIYEKKMQFVELNSELYFFLVELTALFNIVETDTATFTVLNKFAH